VLFLGVFNQEKALQPPFILINLLGVFKPPLMGLGGVKYGRIALFARDPYGSA